MDSHMVGAAAISRAFAIFSLRQSLSRVVLVPIVEAMHWRPFGVLAMTRGWPSMFGLNSTLQGPGVGVCAVLLVIWLGGG